MNTLMRLLVVCIAVSHVAAADGDGCGPISCAMECPYGFMEDPESGCAICACENMMCMDVECVPGKMCEVFPLSPNGGEDVAQCVDPSLPDRCKAPMSRGLCQGNEVRFFYDTAWDSCQEFLYSGCGGNTNKFASLIECDTACNPAVLGVKPGCSSVMCLMHCEFGFEQDDDGCDICKCRTAPAVPAVYNAASTCEEDLECNLYCENGNKLDENGCALCACQQAAGCPPSTCDLNCPHGHRMDSDGCELCVCREQGECSPFDCYMYCPFGRVRDENGCPLCECKDNPCYVLGCAEGTMCQLINNTATCLLDDAWDGRCPERSCFLHCQHGFASDVYGCARCECLAKPAKPCPMKKCQSCEFGYAFDNQGCRSCSCMPDPCDQNTGCGDTQVCESVADCPFASCRYRAKCVDQSSVRRAHIRIRFEHSMSIRDTVNDQDLLEALKVRFMEMMGVHEDQLTHFQLDRLDARTLKIEFHVVVKDEAHEADLVKTVADFLEDLSLDTDVLDYGDAQLIPDLQHTSATYHAMASLPEMEQTTGAGGADTTTIIIVVCVLAGVILLTATIAVAIHTAKTKKAKKRGRNVIYKKATLT